MSQYNEQDHMFDKSGLEAKANTAPLLKNPNRLTRLRNKVAILFSATTFSLLGASTANAETNTGKPTINRIMDPGERGKTPIDGMLLKLSDAGRLEFLPTRKAEVPTPQPPKPVTQELDQTVAALGLEIQPITDKNELSKAYATLVDIVVKLTKQVVAKNAPGSSTWIDVKPVEVKSADGKSSWVVVADVIGSATSADGKVNLQTGDKIVLTKTPEGAPNAVVLLLPDLPEDAPANTKLKIDFFQIPTDPAKLDLIRSVTHVDFDGKPAGSLAAAVIVDTGNPNDFDVEGLASMDGKFIAVDQSISAQLAKVLAPQESASQPKTEAEMIKEYVDKKTPDAIKTAAGVNPPDAAHPYYWKEMNGVVWSWAWGVSPQNENLEAGWQKETSRFTSARPEGTLTIIAEETANIPANALKTNFPGLKFDDDFKKNFIADLKNSGGWSDFLKGNIEIHAQRILVQPVEDSRVGDYKNYLDVGWYYLDTSGNRHVGGAFGADVLKMPGKTIINVRVYYPADSKTKINDVAHSVLFGILPIAYGAMQDSINTTAGSRVQDAVSKSIPVLREKILVNIPGSMKQ